MAKTLTYKKSTTTTLKAVGLLDLSQETIDTGDSGVISISDLLSDFNDEIIELSIKIKEDKELSIGDDDNDNESD
ncbi:MAG: hypothetical protein ACLTBR_03405 [Anaerostipes sp.]|uniref:hypothetical protein n=1 Tax=Anaerostipes sp. TaxID=1872530 RepID=UPI0039941B9C